MGKRDPRIDAYISKSADFAKPVLEHIRKIVREACPQVEETLKWNAPAFMYNKGILCMMASFKKHCAFGFWKGSLIVDRSGRPLKQAMGNFGPLTSVKDLPPKKLLSEYIQNAMELNDAGVKTPARMKSKERKPLVIPTYLKAALKKNHKAKTAFEGFSYTNKKDYVEWLTDARTDATRNRRLEQAVDWMAQGKSRNWKYEKRAKAS